MTMSSNHDLLEAIVPLDVRQCLALKEAALRYGLPVRTIERMRDRGQLICRKIAGRWYTTDEAWRLANPVVGGLTSEQREAIEADVALRQLRAGA